MARVGRATGATSSMRAPAKDSLCRPTRTSPIQATTGAAIAASSAKATAASSINWLRTHMQDTLTPVAMRTTLQYVLSNEMPTQYKSVLIALLTQALRDEDQQWREGLAP